MSKGFLDMTKAEQDAVMAKYQKALDKEAKQKAYNERRRVWMALMVEKAKAAKIEVTDAEIDKALAKK